MDDTLHKLRLVADRMAAALKQRSTALHWLNGHGADYDKCRIQPCLRDREVVEEYLKEFV